MGYRWLSVVILLTNAVYIGCFLPSRSSTTLSDTYTHADITKAGVTRAVANFLTDHGLVNGTHTDSDKALKTYFGSDFDNREKFDKRIGELTARMNSVQRNFGNIAMYTVNGERIEDAFNLLVRLSAQTRALTSVNPYGTDTQQRTFDSLAKALFVIQSFYSNTNWVEMNGATYCPAFGGHSGQLPQRAHFLGSTCLDCDSQSKENCQNNIVTDFLTSGYRPEQNIDLPTLISGKKCGHGWNTNYTELAIGGISKETSDVTSSPHAHIHSHAVDAAIQATETYLYKNGEGILSNLTVENFKLLMDLNSLQAVSKASLTFVIDVSGSMANDIKAVTDTCIGIVSGVQGTSNEPTNYILATFNDPESLTTGTVVTSGDDMISSLRALRVNGGGDCPEYSMSGILKGISLSRNGSTVYLFTDADAKDRSKVSEVIRNANSKDIKIHLLPTGSCSRRRRSIGESRVRRNIDDIYRQIAEGTGGQVFETSTANLTTTLSELITEETPSSVIVVQTFSMSTTDSDRKVVIIDSTMDLFKIEVSGASSVDDVAVEDPTGSTLRYTAGVASRYYSAGKVIISVQKPMAGNWTIVRTRNQALAVNVTGSSAFDFSIELTELDGNGISYLIVGSPISGNNYTITSQLYNLDYNSSITLMTLVDMAGNEVERIKTTVHRTGTDMFAVSDVTMPPESFRVQLIGVLPEGESFQRTNPQVISPVNVKLTLRPNQDEFPLNEPQNITYRLNNYGSTNQTLEVDIDADSARLTTVTYDMYPGEIKEDHFQVTGHTQHQIITYTVSVRQSGSDTILQSLSDTVWFVSPACSISNNQGTCPEMVDPPASCQSITWFSQAVLSPDVTSYELSTNDDNVEISTDNSTDDGIHLKHINVSGDCCAPSVYLSTLGSSGEVNGQCHFHFGSVPTFTVTHMPTVNVSTTAASTNATIASGDSKKFLIVVIAGSGGTFLIIFVLTILIWRLRSRAEKNVHVFML
ncbi:von Willebrand factor A domain-containing protein 7-like [Mizuhopecten yessoensis]|uniref:von Willebrand factor A domain-containing protein 7-like n=1 Tax=Mizuhopecten yessoensis TaxID=6573 RepID=UPI000B457E08|nr:von Willebrand factor A domain-containing protein 7-like [Mizuhopecten yessoensis]